jgi:hypothetical protein
MPNLTGLLRLAYSFSLLNNCLERSPAKISCFPPFHTAHVTLLYIVLVSYLYHTSIAIILDCYLPVEMCVYFK